VSGAREMEMGDAKPERAGILPRLLRALGFRRPAAEAPPAVHLDDVRRRLEIFLAAVHGRPIQIATAEPPPAPGLLRRAFQRTPAHLRGVEPGASSDGERILLPAVLDAADGAEAALARYRLMAVEHAERLNRGTAALVPADEDRRLERDLYLLAESAAVDAAIARAIPGVVPALAAERAAALARRPALDSLTPAEREVERLTRHVLSLDPTAPSADFPIDGGPEASLAWARETAARLSAAAPRYRGVPPVGAWGTVLPVRSGAPIPGAKPAMVLTDAPWMPEGGAGAGVVGSHGNDDAPDPGLPPNPDAPPPPPRDLDDPPPSEPKETREDDSPSNDPPADDSDEIEPASGGAPPEDRAERSGSPAPRAEVVDRAKLGIEYPEWDFRAGRYLRPGALVRLAPCTEGDGGWAARVLAEHGVLVRRLREQFERLRARRLRLTQQRDGEELDLAACVRAQVDVRAGRAVDDRLYAAVRPARRELAILLLVDVSGSTSEPAGTTRIIDIEKTALLLTGEALDALGDRYAILTFSGKSIDHVRVRTVKDFTEPSGEGVRKRIAALEPEGFTRLGAAIRHASAVLARQGAGHQLLLILSDGKPDDVDEEYGGRHGVEDSRQAIAEARSKGIYPFCLTVDRKASAYLPRIFGKSGHVILRDPRHLPMALLKVVQGMLRG
jgi:nitric oxide reductase NorD protein